MAQILVRNLEEQTIKRLKARAQRKGRSLQAEVKEILVQTVQMDAHSAWKLADTIRESLARRFDDSAKLVRKDRDRLVGKDRGRS